MAGFSTEILAHPEDVQDEFDGLVGACLLKQARDEDVSDEEDTSDFLAYLGQSR